MSVGVMKDLKLKLFIGCLFFFILDVDLFPKHRNGTLERGLDTQHG